MANFGDGIDRKSLDFIPSTCYVTNSTAVGTGLAIHLSGLYAFGAHVTQGLGQTNWTVDVPGVANDLGGYVWGNSTSYAELQRWRFYLPSQAARVRCIFTWRPMGSHAVSMYLNVSDSTVADTDTGEVVEIVTDPSETVWRDQLHGEKTFKMPVVAMRDDQSGQNRNQINPFTRTTPSHQKAVVVRESVITTRTSRPGPSWYGVDSEASAVCSVDLDTVSSGQRVMVQLVAKALLSSGSSTAVGIMPQSAYLWWEI